MARFEQLIEALRFETDHVAVEQTMRDAADAIEALQAEVPKRGEWLYGDKMPNYPRIPYKPWLQYCSECGEPTQQDSNALFDYCPNCGARMDGEVEHG